MKKQKREKTSKQKKSLNPSMNGQTAAYRIYCRKIKKPHQRPNKNPIKNLIMQN